VSPEPAASLAHHHGGGATTTAAADNRREGSSQSYPSTPATSVMQSTFSASMHVTGAGACSGSGSGGDLHWMQFSDVVTPVETGRRGNAHTHLARASGCRFEVRDAFARGFSRLFVVVSITLVRASAEAAADLLAAACAPRAVLDACDLMARYVECVRRAFELRYACFFPRAVAVIDGYLARAAANALPAGAPSVNKLDDMRGLLALAPAPRPAVAGSAALAALSAVATGTASREGSASGPAAQARGVAHAVDAEVEAAALALLEVARVRSEASQAADVAALVSAAAAASAANLTASSLSSTGTGSDGAAGAAASAVGSNTADAAAASPPTRHATVDGDLDATGSPSPQIPTPAVGGQRPQDYDAVLNWCMRRGARGNLSALDRVVAAYDGDGETSRARASLVAGCSLRPPDAAAAALRDMLGEHVYSAGGGSAAASLSASSGRADEFLVDPEMVVDTAQWAALLWNATDLFKVTRRHEALARDNSVLCIPATHFYA
jgi:hypothetical protein